MYVQNVFNCVIFLVWRLFNQRFTCDQCGRSYKHKTNLCNHKREECGKPPSYFCPVCKKGFKKKQHLQRHLTVHGDMDLSAYNIDKDILKSLLPQITTKNPEFKNPNNPPAEENPSNNTTSSLPPVSIFPNQVYPYPPLMYPNPLIRPVLMHSSNYPIVQTSISAHDGVNTRSYSQNSMPSVVSHPSEHLRNSVLTTDCPNTEISP